MILALLGALLIGLTLGLLGSGGSILTVPVLVYLVGEAEKVAIAESLGIVAIISLVGALPYAFERQVHWRSVMLFGVPGMAGTYGGAYLSQFMSGTVQLLIFAVVMLLAAALMLRRPESSVESSDASDAAPEAGSAGDGHTPEYLSVDVKAPAHTHATGTVRAVVDVSAGPDAAMRPGPAPVADEARRMAWKLVLEGLMVGVLTGLVGVGGGFLIVPVLVLLGGLNMRLAIGTSLLIISMKSVTGLYKYWDVLGQSGVALDWGLIGLFGAIGIAGSFAGSRAGAYVPQEKLRRGFAVFLLVMAVYIIWQNVGGVG